MIWRDSGPGQGSFGEGVRMIPEETAIALTYKGGTYAVMMGTPPTSRISRWASASAKASSSRLDDIGSLDIVDLGDGVELRMWLPQSKADRLSERRRHIAGPTGCGICGIEFDRGSGPPRRCCRAGPRRLAARDHDGDAGIPPLQPINIETRAVHAAAFWMPARGIVALREDVGRHNALDKLAGALAQRELTPARAWCC